MRPKKTLLLQIFVILAVFAMMTVYPARCQAANPSVPNFTVQYVNNSYYVPPVYQTNPYNGNVTLERPGYTENNETIVVTIQNQPFTPYLYDNNTIYLYYNARCKGHFDDWNDTGGSDNSINNVQASTTSTTTVTFFTQDWNLQPGDQIDFQVEAITGYSHYNEQACGEQYQTIVGSSGWSNTQTITIGNLTSTTTTTTPIGNTTTTTSTPTPEPTPIQSSSPSYRLNGTATPNLPGAQEGVKTNLSLEQIAIIVMAVVIVVFAVAVVVLLHKASGARVNPPPP
jgi:hypothetical protein